MENCFWLLPEVNYRFFTVRAMREVAEHYEAYSKLLVPTGMKISQLALTPRSLADQNRQKHGDRAGANVYQETLGKLGGRVRYETCVIEQFRSAQANGDENVAENYNTYDGRCVIRSEQRAEK